MLLALCLGFASCSSDDESGSNNIRITPPSWTHGAWMHQDSEDIVYKFTADDFITVGGSMEVSQRDFLRAASEAGEDVSATEETTETTYSLKINYSAGSSMSYSFSYISDTEILWDDMEAVLIKQ